MTTPHQLPKPTQSRVPIAVTPGDSIYRCSLNVLLCELGHQARQAHQEDVPTPRTDTQNVFLCRVGRSIAPM